LPGTKIIEIAAGGQSAKATILLRTASGKVFAFGEFVPGPGREESGDTMQQAALYGLSVLQSEMSSAARPERVEN
jgi:hypothetical protein